MRWYFNKPKTNITEKQVQEYYKSLGYKSLSRGWPDFVFYKEKGKWNREYIFIEVKRENQDSIKPAQRKMRNIFRRCGLNYEVCFGVKPDGTPNFRPYKTSGLQRKLGSK